MKQSLDITRIQSSYIQFQIPQQKDTSMQPSLEAVCL